MAKGFFKKDVGDAAGPAVVSLLIGGASIAVAAVVTNELMPKLGGGIGQKTELHPIAPAVVGLVVLVVGEMAENQYISTGGAAMAGYGVLEAVNRNVLKEKAIKMSALGSLGSATMLPRYYNTALPAPVEYTNNNNLLPAYSGYGAPDDMPTWTEAEYVESFTPSYTPSYNKGQTESTSMFNGVV